MGKFSRDKGRRGEYLLRDYLTSIGHIAYRVPLSGASAGFKADVVSNFEGKTYTFELKCRAGEYEGIYAAILPLLDTSSQVNMTADSSVISLTLDFHSLIDAAWVLKLNNDVPEKIKKKILSLRKLLGKADYLVIKGDRRPLLFIKYA